jgi:hypothetical protein
MSKKLKSTLFLLPSIVAIALSAYVCVVDETLRHIVKIIFYVFFSLIATGACVLVLLVLWTMTKTGLALLTGTQAKKQDMGL